ncbi:hypothetical protein SteCoe_24395 [Stentor coeruleus]|uniref:Uncharacterized protein n=1 Tax=Stentor coeruleus TaxID=5963 RepID=A0A1R2BHP1_9CILI|nr:hypothetical protein SteCoe_24395 [Stentor coeruleus]
MAASHLVYCGLFISGSFLQELSQFQETILSDDPFCLFPIKKHLYLFFMFLFGLSLDLYSLLYIPILTYVLLGSCRIAFYNYFNLPSCDLSHKNNEKIGFTLIAISCSIAIFFGGMQQTIQTISIDSNFIIYNFFMTIFLFALKFLKVFNNTFSSEVCITANIGVFKIGIIKIIMLLSIGYIGEDKFSIIFQYTIIGVALIFINYVLFKRLYKQYDHFIIFGTYQIWSLAFGYIIGLVFIFYGASYYTVRVAYCALSGIIGILGIGFLIYEREMFLKDNGNKKSRERIEKYNEMEMVRNKLGNLKDCDENDNLIDCNVVDEDLKINDGKNV